MDATYGSVAFDQQIKIFRNKINIPTERWNDLKRDAHDTGFMVAGAAKADLLADLRGAVAKAIETGTTLETFRSDFAQIVAKHGWTDYTGSGSEAGIAWRTRVIYETNLRSAYQSGRWQQIQAGKATRPYLEYRHSHAVISPRAEHLRWDKLILPVDDPWWQTHYPPSGYGCQCTAFALSQRDLTRMGKTAPDTAPDDGTYKWVDKKTGESHTFPNGVQPFWDYAPGSSLVAQSVSQLSRKLTGVPAIIGASLMDSLQPLIMDQVTQQFSAWVDDVSTANVSRNQTQLMGWVNADIQAALATQGVALDNVAVFAEDRLLVGKKTDRHKNQGDALNIDEWKTLPTLLMTDSAAYLDNNNGKLLYVIPGADRSTRMVVEMDFKIKKGGMINVVRSVSKINAQAFADTTRYTRLN